jgi:hypothetical protein
VSEFYVTVNGEHVEGPFEDRTSAKRRAADLNTTEVGATYRVQKAD